jgi:hypothetical protein
MAITQSITEKDLAERFFLLPQSLQDALEDGFNAKVIREICAQYGITDEDIIGGVADIVAKVFLGFSQPEDLAQELKDEIGFPEEVAQDISLKIRSGLFAPLQDDIQKIYSPTINHNIDPGPGMAPAKIMDISYPASSDMSAKAPMAPSPMSVVPMPAAPRMPMSAPMPMAAKMPMPTPAATTMPKAPLSTVTIKEEPKGWQPTKLPVSGSTPIANATPVSTATPAPFMMHQESSASQMTAGSDFKLNISKDMFKSGPTKQVDIPRPPKAAELEIGKAPLPPKPAGNVSFRTTPASQARVVHYTDLRTGMAPGFPTAQPMPKAAPAVPVTTMPTIKPAIVPVLKTMSAPVPPAPIAPVMPEPPEPIKMTMPPSAPTPVAPAPIGQTASPTMPAMPTTPTPAKPPKVVNFGPEEVK